MSRAHPDLWAAHPEAMARPAAEGGYTVTVVPTLEAAITEGFWSGDPAKLVFVGRAGR